MKTLDEEPVEVHNTFLYVLYFIILYMFFANHRFICVIFSSVAPHRGYLAAKCHPRWQPTRRLAVSCGLGRRRIRTQDCRTTVWCASIEPPRLYRSCALCHFLMSELGPQPNIWRNSYIWNLQEKSLARGRGFKWRSSWACLIFMLYETPLLKNFLQA